MLTLSFAYIFDVLFNLVLVVLEDVGVYELVLFRGFEVHAVALAELSLQLLEVRVKQDLLKHAHCLIESIVLIVTS